MKQKLYLQSGLFTQGEAIRREGCYERFEKIRSTQSTAYLDFAQHNMLTVVEIEFTK